MLKAAIPWSPLLFCDGLTIFSLSFPTGPRNSPRTFSLILSSLSLYLSIPPAFFTYFNIIFITFFIYLLNWISFSILSYNQRIVSLANFIIFTYVVKLPKVAFVAFVYRWSNCGVAQSNQREFVDFKLNCFLRETTDILICFSFKSFSLLNSSLL